MSIRYWRSKIALCLSKWDRVGVSYRKKTKQSTERMNVIFIEFVRLLSMLIIIQVFFWFLFHSHFYRPIFVAIEPCTLSFPIKHTSFSFFLLMNFIEIKEDSVPCVAYAKSNFEARLKLSDKATITIYSQKINTKINLNCRAFSQSKRIPKFLFPFFTVDRIQKEFSFRRGKVCIYLVWHTRKNHSKKRDEKR